MHAYIFDIGSVLVQYDDKEVVNILAQKTKCECGKIDKLFQIASLYDVETGKISCQEFYSRSISKVIPNISYEDWVQTFIDHFKVNPPAMELLLYLKQKGNKVYILSNLAEFHKKAIETKIPDIFGICDKNFFSYELGFHKPEREIYEAVLKDIGERPGNCVFFDDNTKNIEGAKKAGILGILYSNENIPAIYEKIKELEK